MPTCIATAASLSESESNATALKKIRTDQEPQPVANYMWNGNCTICATTFTINALNLVDQYIAHNQYFGYVRVYTHCLYLAYRLLLTNSSYSESSSPEEDELSSLFSVFPASAAATGV